MAVEQPECRIGSAAFPRYLYDAIAERRAVVGHPISEHGERIAPFLGWRGASPYRTPLADLVSSLLQWYSLPASERRYWNESRDEEGKPVFADMPVPGDMCGDVAKFLFPADSPLRAPPPLVSFLGRSSSAATDFASYFAGIRDRILDVRFVTKFTTAGAVALPADDARRLVFRNAGISVSTAIERAGEPETTTRTLYPAAVIDRRELPSSLLRRPVARYFARRDTFIDAQDPDYGRQTASRQLRVTSAMLLCNPTPTKADVYAKVEFEGTPAGTFFPTLCPLADSSAPGKWKLVGSVEPGESFTVCPVIDSFPDPPFILDAPFEEDNWRREVGAIDCYLSLALDFGPYFNYLPAAPPDPNLWNDEYSSFDPPQDEDED